jgi:hypothetical protein
MPEFFQMIRYVFQDNVPFLFTAHFLLPQSRKSIMLLLKKYYMGAFFAPQKTGLCGGSAAPHGRWPPAVAPPLQSLAQLRRPPLAATAYPQAPQEVSIIPMIDTWSLILN